MNNKEGILFGPQDYGGKWWLDPVRMRKNAAAPSDNPLTRDEYRAYLHQIVQLKLYFLYLWLQSHPDEVFGEVLEQRVDIYRKIECYAPRTMSQDHPDFGHPFWVELKEKIRQLHEQHAAHGKAEDFMWSAFDLLRPALDANLEASFSEALEAGRNMKCGSLTYHAPSENTPTVIAVHIANAIQPQSIFDDPHYLPGCLVDLMDRSEAEFGVCNLHCGSWLNSHPRWLALFPREWQESLSESDRNVQWHLGYWGQFISARGTFHEKNAMRFCQTGEFPFAYRTADCGFAALREHLHELFGV